MPTDGQNAYDLPARRKWTHTPTALKKGAQLRLGPQLDATRMQWVGLAVAETSLPSGSFSGSGSGTSKDDAASELCCNAGMPPRQLANTGALSERIASASRNASSDGVSISSNKLACSETPILRIRGSDNSS
eukprot:scaffold25495_cov121-Isochrysis_galbana.AAC.2